MDLTTPLTYVKGIGPGRAAMLEAKGLVTVEDLLGYVALPLRGPQQPETDRPARAGRDGDGDRGGALGQGVAVQAAQPGHVRSALHRCFARHPGRASGSTAATWRTCWPRACGWRSYGKVEFDSYTGELTMLHPEFEILSGDDDEGEASLHTGRVVPIYEARGKITTRVSAHADASHSAGDRRRWTTRCRQHILRDRLKMPDRWTAMRDIHFPPPDTRPAAAECVPLARRSSA